VDLGEPMEARVQSYSPGGASVHNINRIRRILVNNVDTIPETVKDRHMVIMEDCYEIIEA